MSKTLGPDSPERVVGPDAETSEGQSGPAHTTSEGRRIGLSRRDWSMILCGVAGAASVTVALLMSNGVASPHAAAAAVPAPKPSSSAASAPTPVATPKWSSENRDRWVANNRKSIAFELPARNRVAVWMKHVRPMLVVRCASNRTEVFVFTESAAKMEQHTDDHTVRFRFDDEPAVSERWADSVDHDGLFAPDGAVFAQRLIAARTLRFEFTPHNVASVEIQFDVSGLGDLLEPAAKECSAK